MLFQRLIAQIIDFILYPFASILILTLSVNILAVVNLNESTDSILNILVLSITFLVSFYIYYFVQYKHILKGQTWGYRMMGLKIEYPENSNKKRLAIIRTILRPFLGMLVMTMLFAVLHIFILMNSQGEEGLMDFLLKTKIRKANS